MEQDDSLENANLDTNNCKQKNTHSNSSSRRASLADIMLSRTRKGSAPESDETKIDMPHYNIPTEKFADKKVKVKIFHIFYFYYKWRKYSHWDLKFKYKCVVC